MFPLPRTGILKVNGASLPDPQSISFGIQDLDAEEGTGRSATGKMFRDRVAVKRTLNIVWTPMNIEDMRFILRAVSDEFFQCQFIDPEDGTVTKTMYVGNRTAPLLMKDRDTGEWIWQSLSANFIEQ